MSLDDTLQADYLSALRAKATAKVSTLRLLRAAIQNELIAKHLHQATDELVQQVLKREVKKRQDAIAAYRQGGRDDLAHQEQAELEMLQIYLPAQLGPDKLKPIIAQIVQGLEQPNFGSAMKAVMAKVGAQADGKLVAELVKEYFA